MTREQGPRPPGYQSPQPSQEQFRGGQPLAWTTPTQLAGPLPRASFGRRLGAFAVDLGIIVAAELILSVVVGFVVVAIAAAGYDNAAAVVGVLLGLVVFALYAAFPILYFGYLEGQPRGQTFGKRSLGVRVVDFESAGSVPMGRAMGRSLARTFLSGLLLLGYLWMLWDPQEQTWHDKLTHTTVVPVSAYPV